MDAKQIAKLINEVKDGVDKSTFGPMFQYPDMKDITKRNVNQLAMMVFNSLLSVAFAEELAKERKANGEQPRPAGV